VMVNKESRKAGSGGRPALKHARLTEKIIGAAIEVHRHRKQGLLLKFAAPILGNKRVILE